MIERSLQCFAGHSWQAVVWMATFRILNDFTKGAGAGGGGSTGKWCHILPLTCPRRRGRPGDASRPAKRRFPILLLPTP